jgi:hypothetical protein
MTVVDTPLGMYAVLAIHHSLYDGWSLSMLFQDLLDLADGKPVAPRSSFTRYIDYINSQDYAATEEYWREYLADMDINSIGASQTLQLEDGEAPEEPVSLVCSTSMPVLKESARRVGVSVAELAKLAWAATLRKYTRKNDVLFGQVLANRELPIENADRYYHLAELFVLMLSW